MRMITRMSPNDMVLSPPNKTTSKEAPHHAGDGVGVHGAGQVIANILLRPALRICSKLNTFQIVHTVFGSLVISTATQTLPADSATHSGTRRSDYPP
jgi:hypothetical protein